MMVIYKKMEIVQVNNNNKMSKTWQTSSQQVLIFHQISQYLTY